MDFQKYNIKEKKQKEKGRKKKEREREKKKEKKNTQELFKKKKTHPPSKDYIRCLPFFLNSNSRL